MPKNSDIKELRIFLVRHGQTDWNRTGKFQGRSDVPLNAEGKRQVRATAAALKDVPFDAIYASPLTRAMETATIIGADHPAAPLIREDSFIEMEIGDFDGMDAKEWMSAYADFAKRWRENPGKLKMPGPGGESLEEVQLRAMEALDAIAKTHSMESTLLVCSHNFVILSILCAAGNISLDRFRTIRQDTAAYSIIRRNNNRYAVETMNENAHLDP